MLRVGGDFYFGSDVQIEFYYVFCAKNALYIFIAPPSAPPKYAKKKDMISFFEKCGKHLGGAPGGALKPQKTGISPKKCLTTLVNHKIGAPPSAPPNQKLEIRILCIKSILKHIYNFF